MSENPVASNFKAMNKKPSAGDIFMENENGDELIKAFQNMQLNIARDKIDWESAYWTSQRQIEELTHIIRELVKRC